ncbi:hypothetical protein [Erwinia sp. HR93]|uniref:hypothetical protein n=1 Tax=Erwinia sp. HR93 TaxID=3094840 RepID=UPI002ADED92D|nr:hypothetical protein [Erwinia sp. HR93]MEA1064742.1 hypothetical protein [Erwinia sp. HR93]
MGDSDRPGREKLAALMERMASMRGAEVRVGIPRAANARKRQDDSPLGNAALMAVHEYGATINVPARQASITRQIRADGSFSYSGRFRKKGNFQSFHLIPAHTITIPERSVFRYTFHQQKYFNQQMRRLARQVMRGEISRNAALNRLGAYAQGKLRGAFTDGHMTPNAPSTIRRKGSSKPLIDTGSLRQAITFILTGEGSG